MGMCLFGNACHPGNLLHYAKDCIGATPVRLCFL
jgi:hypothetical protein